MQVGLQVCHPTIKAARFADRTIMRWAIDFYNLDNNTASSSQLDY